MTVDLDALKGGGLEQGKLLFRLNSVIVGLKRMYISCLYRESLDLMNCVLFDMDKGKVTLSIRIPLLWFLKMMYYVYLVLIFLKP